MNATRQRLGARLGTRVGARLQALPQPRRSAFGVGALVVVGLSLTQALGSLLPSTATTEFGEGSQRNFVRAVSPGGGAVALRTGDLAITGVEGATTVTRPYTYPASTDAVFLVVRFAWTPRAETSTIVKATLFDGRGRRFTVTSLSAGRDGVSCLRPPPGITADCVAVVEVPRDALAGSRIQLSTNAIDDALDDVAEADLTDAVGLGSLSDYGRGRTAPVEATYRGLE